MPAKLRRRRIFVLNDPHALRISPQLAQEIGLNESIVLLQLEFLISISDHEREGKIWTYQSVRELQRTYFPWWGIATISRTIKSLEEKELILIGNFNRDGYDKTQWFALNEVGLAHLTSIQIEGREVFQNETGVFQPETSVIQNGTPLFQNGTTIPETTSEITSEKKRPMTIEELEAAEKRHQEIQRWTNPEKFKTKKLGQ